MVRSVLVTPLTGPLARFGRAGATALELWAVAGRVKLEVVDAHPDPAGAMVAACRRRADVVFGPYGSGPAVAAFEAVAALDGPALWNHGGATSRLAWPEFPRVLNVLAPASTYFAGLLEAARDADPSIRTVTVVHADSGFGRDVGDGAIASARRLGYEVVNDGEVLVVAGPFEFEVEAASRLLGRPWRVAGLVGAGVEDVLAELGERREGLAGPSQWHAPAAMRREPAEGPSTAWFVDAYRRATGEEPEYPAAQAFAAGVLAARCVREAGSSDPAAVVAAATRLRCDTLYGDFRLDPETGRQLGHHVLTVQWQQGRRRVVWPRESAEAPLQLMG